ncbi:MAG: peptide deformylase, partial [Proteobacteria bacterium]|nr:peptide deformylase [Pseudomonadota bacterium]
MAIKNIVLAGTPQLRHITKLVPQALFGSAQLNEMIDALFETMKARKGVGLAASQIGVEYRLMVYGFDSPHPRYPDQDPVPLTLMVNPQITQKS